MVGSVSAADRERLSDWCRLFGRSPRVSWQMLKAGRLPDDAEVHRSGRIFYVRSNTAVAAASPRTALYARVPSSDQAADYFGASNGTVAAFRS